MLLNALYTAKLRVFKKLTHFAGLENFWRGDSIYITVVWNKTLSSVQLMSQKSTIVLICQIASQSTCFCSTIAAYRYKRVTFYLRPRSEKN